MNRRFGLKRRRYQHLLNGEEHDPLAGVSNLFDVAMVFAVALLIALFARVPAHELFDREAARATSDSSKQRADSIPDEGDQLERFQIGDREAGGKGQRLGVAYKLPTGEIVYVPEPAKVPSD